MVSLSCQHSQKWGSLLFRWLLGLRRSQQKFLIARNVEPGFRAKISPKERI